MTSRKRQRVKISKCSGVECVCMRNSDVRHVFERTFESCEKSARPAARTTQWQNSSESTCGARCFAQRRMKLNIRTRPTTSRAS
eukprot:77504-Prymnesium_polylepis.1